MTHDLIAWLRAQLDDDERVARAVPEGPWEERDATPCHPDVISVPRDREHGRDEVVLSDVWRDGMTDYATRYDPSRVLAEVDAKRRILDLHEYDQIDVSLPGGPPETMPGRRPPTAGLVLRLLALPYAGRPGYRDEWKP